MTKIDIAGIAAAALPRADELVPRWLPGGHCVGAEWQCADLAGSPGDSLKVNLKSGRWADFATDARGGDLVALLAAIRGCSQLEAARELGAELGLQVSSAIAATPTGAGDGPHLVHSAPPRALWHDAGPWPEDGPPMPVAHYVRGAHQARWIYRDADGRILGAVSRYVTSTGGKEILPLVWSASEGRTGWKWRAFDEPRPLFNLDRLARPGLRPVLVVEGEKCAELAQQLLGDEWDATTWPGGCKAARKARWSLLAGRDVVIWPDCDGQVDATTRPLPEARQPGMRAAETIAAALAQHASRVRIVKIPAPGTKVPGWDIADFVAEHTDDAARARELVLEFIAPGNLREPGLGSAAAEAAPIAGWRGQLRMGNGGAQRTLSNVELILSNDSRWEGVLGFDEFASRIVKLQPPPYAGGVAGEWTEDDDSRTAIWMARNFGCDVYSALVGEAVAVAARSRSFHPVRAWLRSLRWDGERRLDTWLTRHLGVADSQYAQAVGTYFMRGMVKRVISPGCKFDYCIVFEGRQGIGKSSVAMVLGGDYYSDTDLDLAHKDSMSALRGIWLHEFAEMDAIARAEAPKQKSFLSRQMDLYRPTYARREIRCLRQTVFVGTTNEDEYLRDSTGARRFWPVRCGEIRLDTLRRERAQLFAEALVDVDSGARVYPLPEEAREIFWPQQQERVVQESLIDALHDWVLSDDRLVQHDGVFSLSAAALAIGIGAAQLTRDHQTRIGKALAALGCTKIEKRNGMSRFWYKPPMKVARARIFAPASEHSAEDDDHLAQ